MLLKHGLISVDDHVQEPPELWAGLATRWGDRAPHLEELPDGSQRWVAGGQTLLAGRVASAGALMPERTREARRWEDVPEAAYRSEERLQLMDGAGIDYSVLYPTVAGLAGERFGRLDDPALELACVQAYNDWLIGEWATASERFIPQCIVPI